MKELLVKLKDLGDKAEYLRKRTGELVEENRSLKARIIGLEQNVEERNTDLQRLEEQYDILKMARRMGEGTDEDDDRAAELKKKINDYIREIDQCLKLIGD